VGYSYFIGRGKAMRRRVTVNRKRRTIVTYTANLVTGSAGTHACGQGLRSTRYS
jgi:hypothetical protein